MIEINADYRKWLFLIPIPILMTGIIGFRLLEGWSWVDCFYMTVTTMFTVGYGWISEPDDKAKIFATVLILFGVGTFSFLISLGIQSMVEGVVNQHGAARRRARKMKDHYIICGAGRIGMEIAQTLKMLEKPFILVENNPARIEELRSEGMPYLPGDATNEEVLIEAGCQRAKGLACVLQNDADNVFVILVAREMNAGLFIVARSSHESSISKMLKAGANKVINPFATTANRMAYTLIKPTVVDFLEVASSERKIPLRIEEVFIPEKSPLVGRCLSESELRQRENVIAAAIQKSDGRMVFNPLPSEKIDAGDVLIALGLQDSLDALAKRAGGRP